jgi:hypothetical protein
MPRCPPGSASSNQQGDPPTREEDHGSESGYQRLSAASAAWCSALPCRTSSDIEIVAINDLLEPDYLAYMLQVRLGARPLQGRSVASKAVTSSSTARRSA